MSASPEMRTSYMGLDLSNPLVASAGPMTGRVSTLRRLEEAGVAAVVLPSLFEEDVARNAAAVHGLLAQGTYASGEAQTYLPELPAFEIGPERSIRLVADAKAALSIPVIASVNGTSAGGWVYYAKQLVDAGADALELNVYFVAADPSGAPGDLRTRYVDLVGAVAESIPVPLAVKIGPYFDSTAQMAVALDDAGADGLVLFNRFYQPDIDIETLDVAPVLELSTPSELRLPLRWIAILSGRLGCSLAASGGVHDSEGVVKALLAGADVVMTTSSLLLHGPEHVGTLIDGLVSWMVDNDYDSVGQMRGSVSSGSVPDPDAYERANYLEVMLRATDRYLR